METESYEMSKEFVPILNGGLVLSEDSGEFTVYDVSSDGMEFVAQIKNSSQLFRLKELLDIKVKEIMERNEKK